MFDQATRLPKGEGEGEGGSSEGQGLKQLPGRTDRMFPELPDLHADPDKLLDLAVAMIDPVPENGLRRNPGLPFGYAVFGSFVEHDLATDPAPLHSLVGPSGSPHAARPPRLELDCVFGGSAGATRAAARRSPEPPAIAALAPVFRRAATALAARRGPGGEDAWGARAALVRHYQWIVLEDWLPRFCDAGVLAELRRGGPRAFAAPLPFLPLEFSLAAVHLLHGLDRRAIDDPGQHDAPGAGRGPAPLRTPPTRTQTPWGDWAELLGNTPVLCRRFGPRLDVPEQGGAAMAARLLFAGNAAGLPSGQAVAGALGVPPLEPEALGSGPDGATAARVGLIRQTPLWYYLLKEAETRTAGRRFGPVGSRIYAETVLAAVEGDGQGPRSAWRPSLPGRQADRFDLVDLLRLAGVALGGARVPARATG